MNKLFLIDGHALVFKMYYAFLAHPMINSQKVDTSILFGFTKYLLELIEREKPSHLAVSFDPPGGTFRNKLFPEYKANRSDTPQLVIDALEPLMQIVGALNIPVLMMPGYEADDVIGSAARQFASEQTDIYMVTPDKDYGQLIAPHLYQYRPGKPGADNEILGPEEICRKWNISSPSQVIDILTICGDSSDNIPGVQGVGPVGAAKLLAQYGSVDAIYEHLSELSPRQQALFSAAQDHIGLSKQLVTIKTDIVIELNESDLRLNLTLNPQIEALFNKFEFPSLRRLLQRIITSSSSISFSSSSAPEPSALQSSELQSSIPPTQAENSKAAQTNSENPASEQMAPSKFVKLALQPKELSADTFQKSIYSNKLTRIALSYYGNVLYLCDGDAYACGSAEDFRIVLEDEQITKEGIGLKNIIKNLSSQTISLKGKLHDLELMHYLINPESSHKLEEMAYNYLGVNLDEAQNSNQSASLFDEIDSDSEELRQGNIKRTAILLPLSDTLLAELKQASLYSLYEQIEEPLIGVLARMEELGVKIELSSLQQYAQSLRESMLQYETTVRSIAQDPSLNVSSPKQIGVLVFEKLALDPKARKPKNGNWPTDETTLQELSDRSPVIEAILGYRGQRKLLSTYIEPLPGYISPLDGRVHTTFNQALTATGRLSSSNPNLQNIPIRTDQGRILRKAFVSGKPQTLMMSADYSQIELRIMAHLCSDEHLTQAFRQGQDVHSATAAKIFGISVDQVNSEQRRIAKTANFGIMYGISAFGLSQRLHCSRQEAKKIIDDYFLSFPSIRQFIDSTISFARENGYVQTLYGRRRYLKDINSTNANLRALAERNAVNAPIQGTAADIIKLAMIRVDRRLWEASLRSRMVLQIHDELLLEVPFEEIDAVKSILKQEMENVISLSVPLTIECNYGENWLDAH